MAQGATRFRLSPRSLTWTIAGAAACLISVGGFQLWQAAAIQHQAAAAQDEAAAAWDSPSEDAVSPAGPQAIARLTDDDLGVDLYILPDADWDSLKDGPGLFAGVMPGAPGTSVIAGHRETHFAFLQDLAVGDRLTIEDRDGQNTEFRVTDTRVVDGRTVRVGGGDTDETARAELMLVTCFPFDAPDLGPDRYVVTLVRS